MSDEARTPQPTDSRINPGVAIVGFVFCFIAGAGMMWGVDARSARTGAGITADRAGAAHEARVSANAVHVDLHVMAQCPYGVQAESAFKDVVSKLGSDLDLNVEYIGQSQGGEPSSMHGPNEVKGDLFQVCAKKYAPERRSTSSSARTRTAKRSRRTARRAPPRSAPLPTRSPPARRARKGKDLLLASFKRSQDKGASGSPTIFIAGTEV